VSVWKSKYNTIKRSGQLWNVKRSSGLAYTFFIKSKVPIDS